jgi:predicted NUDIX family NTP pyrophosphohydrolase
MTPGRASRGRISGGVLLFRRGDDGLEVLLVHPGGPFWAKRDAGAWSIPKGEVADGEDPRAAAWREFGEELGTPAPEGDVLELGEVRQKAGKTVLEHVHHGMAARVGARPGVPGGRPSRLVRPG